jgi:hypothetical protein
MPNWLLRIESRVATVNAGNPTELFTVSHGLVTGDSVEITGSTIVPSVNGTHTVTVTGVDYFTVPVDTTPAGAISIIEANCWFYGGDQRGVVVGADISMPINERHVMRFRTLDRVPKRMGRVEAYAQDGTTRLFTGVMVHRRIVPQVERALPFFCDVTCGDYSTYADLCYQTRTYSTGPTLEAVLDDLVADKLTAYGIAVHGSQVTGPTLDPFEWRQKRVSDCLRELSEKTGYAWRVDADKKLRMFVPGTDAAPYTITGGDGNHEELSWEDFPEPPVNKVSVWCGPDATDPVTKTWIQAGAATSWVTDIPSALGVTPPPTVLVNGVTKTVDVVAAAADYLWTASTSTLSLDLGTLPTNGWAIVLVYVAQFPFLVTATTGASPVVEATYTRTEIVDYAAGVADAEGLLDQRAQDPKTMTLPSTKIGWLPGQAIDISTLQRGGIDFATATITRVDIQMLTDGFWRYTITAQETAIPQTGYLGHWRELTRRRA